MSIRDPEVLEALRDQPELLALADAVAATQPRPRRVGLRPALLRIGGVAAVAAGVLLAFVVWPGGSGRTQGILGRALAAIGDDRVMHVVVQTPSGFELVELSGGRTIAPTDEVEVWSDRGSQRAHAVIRERGRIVAEMLRPDDPGSALGEPDPAFAALWTGYQKALADKTATLVGEDSIYGHRVYWLQFRLPEHGGPGSQVAVDQRSYRTVAFRAYGGGKGRFIPERVLLAQTEPFSDSDFRRKTARPNPLDAGTSAGTASGVEPGHPLQLRKPWLTAGSSIHGVRLTGVGPLTVTSKKRTSRGVELAYGSPAGTRWIQIDELKNRADPSEWRGIPAGFVRISPAGEEHPRGGGSTRTLWTGELVVNGLYVRIETDLGRDAVLAVARALKPV